MKFLIDTNIFIPLEPGSTNDLEDSSPLAAKFLKIASNSEHQIYIHPHIKIDLEKDKNCQRKDLHLKLIKKYELLPYPPELTKSIEDVLGVVSENSNHWVDHHLLCSLKSNAINYLITNDGGIHSKSRRLGIDARVIHLSDAISLIETLFNEHPTPPPAVELVKVHSLDINDPIFDTLKQDYYPDFESWFETCQIEHRDAWVIRDADRLSAICIIKEETKPCYGMLGNILKICCFKVSNEYNGYRYGELLLKSLFNYLFKNNFDWCYVTAFSKHKELIYLFESFGLDVTNEKSPLGENVLTKKVNFTNEDYEKYDNIEFNRRFGPPSVKWTSKTYIIPIQPHYHEIIFPEFEQQGTLFPGIFPFGNGIKKAYLSHAPIRNISIGSNILFYRSKDKQSVTVVGIIEGFTVSNNPDVIAEYVGKRTVFSYEEIASLCRSGDVLAILFRQVKHLSEILPYKTLINNGIINGVPQTMSAVNEENIKWLKQKAEK